MQQQPCQLRRTPRAPSAAIPPGGRRAQLLGLHSYLLGWLARIGAILLCTTTFLLRLLFKRFIVTLISFPWFSTVFLPPQFFCYVGGSPFSAQTELYLYYIKVQWLIEFKVVTKHDNSQANNLSNYQQFTLRVKAKCETVTFDDKLKITYCFTKHQFLCIVIN